MGFPCCRLMSQIGAGRPMNIFSRILAVEDVMLGVDVKDKRSLFEQAAERLSKQHGLAAGMILTRLLEREKLGSTGIGQGVAIPHARVDGLKEPLAMYMRPVAPIGFEAPDRQPVRDVVVLLAPEHANRDHLRILAETAQLFSDRKFREKLDAADSPEHVRQLFTAEV
ncbi:PTS sugar transporter subunit IIA [Burkholderiaceae bacterium DAT-1]|nr:PTS sugar transporter subunit IIA [Burkholderiaceae bacterium DAT-1]